MMNKLPNMDTIDEVKTLRKMAQRMFNRADKLVRKMEREVGVATPVQFVVKSPEHQKALLDTLCEMPEAFTTKQFLTAVREKCAAVERHEAKYYLNRHFAKKMLVVRDISARRRVWTKPF